MKLTRVGREDAFADSRTAFDDDLADAGRVIFITNELWLLQARKEGDHYVEYKTRLA